MELNTGRRKPVTEPDKLAIADYLLEDVNPLRAKFFRGNNIYMYFMSFLNIAITRVVEILHQVRQERAYST